MDAPKFLQLKPREEVLDVIHASLAPHAGRFVLLTMWLALPFFFSFPLWRQGVVGVIVFFAWLLCGILLLARAYFRWSRTVLIVTDQRVVDHDQCGFFHRVVTEARHDQVDEVSYRVKGVWPTIFRYGTVELQLEGASADIEFPHVPRPASVADLLNDLRSQANARDTQ